jgi:hypothetical protein
MAFSRLWIAIMNEIHGIGKTMVDRPWTVWGGRWI